MAFRARTLAGNRICSVVGAFIGDIGTFSRPLRFFSSQTEAEAGGGIGRTFTRRKDRNAGSGSARQGGQNWPRNFEGSGFEVDPAGQAARDKEKPHVYVSQNFVDSRGMQIVFLGTSSSMSTLKRNNTSIALRVEGSIFLFDCGEGALRQFMKTPLKQYDVGNIFITHMHGDHVYTDFQKGLLCRIGLKEFQHKDPIQIYGPKGLRHWIRTTLNASHARVYPKYVVHELHLRKMSLNLAYGWNNVEENHEDELPGRDIHRSDDGVWEVLKDDKYRVRAGFLKHSVPCWGYVIEEHTRRGRFDVERARQAGVKPGKYFRSLEAGEAVTLADGKIVYPADVLGFPRRGRKVVILGDTCDSKSLLAAAQEADVLVHEATVLAQDASEVIQRQHSSAKMAGEFARKIKANTLILTHFSPMLDGAFFVDERSTVRETMKDIVDKAKEAFQEDNVIAAEDLMAVTVQLQDKPPIEVPTPSTLPTEEEEEKLPRKKKCSVSLGLDLKPPFQKLKPVKNGRGRRSTSGEFESNSLSSSRTIQKRKFQPR